MVKNKEAKEYKKLEGQRGISKKLAGLPLSESEINSIVSGISEKILSISQASQFLLAVQKNGMTSREIYWLTHAMVKTGSVLKWKDKIIADKH